MTPEAVSAFLGTRSTAVVVAGPPGAAPHGAIARFDSTGGRITFSVSDDAMVARALDADDEACCIVDLRSQEGGVDDYYATKAAMLHGRARRIDGGAPETATFEFTVEKVVSFDFAKLLAEKAG